MRELVVILHSDHAPIPESEAKAALSEADVRRLSTIVALGTDVRRDETSTHDWNGARRALAREYTAKIAPAFRSGAAFAYFGLAPIPLALQLGYLLEDLSQVDVYQRHHDRHDWPWARDEEPVDVRVRASHPVFRTDLAGDVVIRVTTWHPIDAEATRAVLPDGCLVEIDIELDRPGRDAISRPEDIRALADAFRRQLDDVSDHMKNATIHLFAAVPVGVAVEMGRQVSATKHLPVQTYQYYARETPAHRRAFVLQQVDAPAAVALAEDELAAAAVERELWGAELRALAERATDPRTDQWATRLGLTDDPRWRSLPSLAEVGHVLTEVIDEPTNEFEYREGKGWALSPTLLLGIRERLVDESSRRLAARLFFLHEALHHEWHKLVPGVSDGVGRLPRVLEELDYQADVWAVLQELAAGGDDDLLGRARRMIDTILSTLWAFNPGEGPLDELPVRRVHRYLIWYWQAVRLERARSTEQVVAALTRKPTIEIAGLRPHTVGERVIYHLDDSQHELEIGVLEDDRIARRPHGRAYRIQSLVTAFRNRDGEAIKAVLRPVFQEMQPRATRLRGEG